MIDMTPEEQAKQLFRLLDDLPGFEVSGNDRPTALQILERALRDAYDQGNRDARTEGGGS